VDGVKRTRNSSGQPLFSQGMIYAPDRDWSDLVITEMSMFPTGRYSDLTDSSSMALKYLRDVGLAESDEEVSIYETEMVRPRPRLRALYNC
jgi:phage terminase large subunit-like protein